MVATAISSIVLSTRFAALIEASSTGRLALMLAMGVAGHIRLAICTVICALASGSAGESARPSALSVRGPAMPSASMPSLFWKAMTAACVPPPYCPSMVPGLKPLAWSACWSAVTSSPESPS